MHIADAAQRFDHVNPVGRAFAEGNRLRAQADYHLGPCPRQGNPGGQGAGQTLGKDASRLFHHRLDKVHGRAADETGNKTVVGVAVQIQRRADLFDAARAQHHDRVGQCHGLDLIMGHIDHGCADFAVQTRDFDAHFYPQFGVKVGQGFVEQEHLGAAHDGPANRHALTLPAGQGLGLAGHQGIKFQDTGGFGYFAVYLGLGMAGHLQAKAHVFGDRHMRVKRVGLKHHGHATFAGVHLCHVARPDADGARRRVLQPGDHPQQCRLAAAGRADKDAKLALIDRQINPVNNAHLAKLLGHAGKCYA